MYLLFQKILLIHTNFLIPNTHPYVWFKLSYECFRVPFLPLYLLFWPFWGLFTHIGVSKTWPHKKDVHHFWSLHPPWRYAPSVGLKHDTNGNFLALGLTWIPKMGGWLLYYMVSACFWGLYVVFSDFQMLYVTISCHEVRVCLPNLAKLFAALPRVWLNIPFVSTLQNVDFAH